jgi:sec-independent protein translocase protein TatC
LIWSLCAVAAGFFVAFGFKEEIYGFLSRPLKAVLPPGASLIFTAPAEAFVTYLKVAFLAGLVGASPVVFYQLWGFISPGLYKNERRLVWPFVIMSSGLFLSGAVFCYMVVFPYAFAFFMTFADDKILPMIKLSEYLSFSAVLLAAFGLVFEMPLVLVFLGRLGVVNQKMLRKQRRYAILIIFIVAALFTPPDVISQLLMAAPLLVLYEVSIWLVAASEKKKAQRQAEEEAEFAGGQDNQEQAPPKD